MKIAIFSDTFPPQINGVASVAADSALMLANAGHDVRVFTTYTGTPEFLANLTKGKYKVYKLPSLPFWGYPDLRATIPLGLARRQFRQWRPDIIHSHTPFGAGLEAVWAGKKFGIPVVGTHHTFFDHYLKHIHLDYDWMRRMSWRFTAKYYNRGQFMLSPSQSLADDLKANGLTIPMEVLPNPTNTGCFLATPGWFEAKAEVGKPVANPNIIFMGRLSYEKSVDIVIAAFAIARQSLPNAHLTLVGDGPERTILEEQVKKLQIEDAVTFTGLKRGPDLVAELQKADLFATASKTENMPVSVVEGMACGLPVVAVDAKGLPELVKHEEAGLISEPDDVASMAANMVRILSDQAYQRKLAVGAHTHVQQFSPAAIAARTIAIYERMITANK